MIATDKQMAPIHPVEAPEGLGHLRGSVYDFFRHYRRHEGPAFAVRPVMLNRLSLQSGDRGLRPRSRLR